MKKQKLKIYKFRLHYKVEKMLFFSHFPGTAISSIFKTIIIPKKKFETDINLLHKDIMATHVKLDVLLANCQTLLKVSDSCPTLRG